MLQEKAQVAGLTPKERRTITQQHAVTRVLVRNALNNGGNLIPFAIVAERIAMAESVENSKMSPRAIVRTRKHLAIRKAEEELSELLSEPIVAVKRYVDGWGYDAVGFSSQSLNQLLPPLDLLEIKFWAAEEMVHTLDQLKGRTESIDTHSSENFLLSSGLRKELGFSNLLDARLDQVRQYQDLLRGGQETEKRSQAAKLLRAGRKTK